MVRRMYGVLLKDKKWITDLMFMLLLLLLLVILDDQQDMVLDE